MKTTLTVLLILELYGLSSTLVKRHFFVNRLKNWDDARRHCQKYYNDLSSFTDESEEKQFLEDAVNQTSDAWIGLNRKSGDWKWSEGENAIQINWDTAMNQPDGNYLEERCGFLYNNTKKLHDEKCQKQHPFFCMTKSVLMPQKETWEGALKYCRRYNYNLASLSSDFSMNAAIKEISQPETEYVWTGLHFLAGEWRWISGDNFNNLSRPVTGQTECPASNLRCGALHRQKRTLMSINCEENLSFICQ